MKAATFNVTDTYTSDLTVATQEKVVRRRSTSSFVISLCIAAVGTFLLLLAISLEDKTTAVYSASLIFAIAGILVGLSMALFGGKQWVYLPTKSVVKLRSYYIDPSLQYAVCQAIEMRDISQLPELKEQPTSNVRLDVYISRDRQFTGVQTLVYEPYTYTAVTPICCAYGEKAKELSHLF